MSFASFIPDDREEIDAPTRLRDSVIAPVR
jgi:hypothetical protein